MGIPASAAATQTGYELAGLSSSAYLSVTGSGFSFANNTSISVGFDLYSVPSSTETIAQYALASTNGWQVQINSSGNVLLTTPGGGASINCGTARIGFNVLAATRDQATTNTLRTGLDNFQSPLTFALPTYVAPTGSSVSVLGNDDTHATAFTSGAVQWVQGYSSVLSDADIAKKSANGTLNSGESGAGYHNLWVPDTTASEANLAFDWEIGAGQDWNGVASTSTSGGSSPVTYTVTGSPTRTSLSAQVVTEGNAHAYLQDNGISSSPWSVHARYVVSTNATKVCVVGTTNTFDVASFGYYLGGGIWTVSGTSATWQNYYYGAWANNVPGTQCFQLTGSGTQTVEVWNGPQALESGTVQSTTMNAMWFTNGTLQSVSAVAAPANRLVVLGDSITADGFFANPVAENGHEALYRNATRSDLQVTWIGWGNASLHAMCASYGSCSALASAVATAVTSVQSGGDEVVLLALMTNDYYLPTESATNYGTDVTSFATALHADAPLATLYGHGCTTMSSTTESTANSYGNVPDDYRNEMATVFSGLGAWAHYANYKTVVTTSDLYVDGIHLINSGHAKVEAQLKTDLGF